jgi:hypothetical protein
MTQIMKSIVFIAFFASSAAFAETLKVSGMTCSGCEKQVRGAVCMDKEMKTWFASCNAKVVDADKEVGEINYILNPGVKLDAEKMSKLEKAIADTGRSLVKTP